MKETELRKLTAQSSLVGRKARAGTQISAPEATLPTPGQPGSQCRGHVLRVTVIADHWPASGRRHRSPSGVWSRTERNKASPFPKTEPSFVGDVKTRVYEGETVPTQNMHSHVS